VFLRVPEKPGEVEGHIRFVGWPAYPRLSEFMSLALRPEQPFRFSDLGERFTASGEQAKAVPLLVIVFLIRQAEFRLSGGLPRDVAR
jgi:hypothetical protein